MRMPSEGRAADPGEARNEEAVHLKRISQETASACGSVAAGRTEGTRPPIASAGSAETPLPPPERWLLADGVDVPEPCGASSVVPAPSGRTSGTLPSIRAGIVTGTRPDIRPGVIETRLGDIGGLTAGGSQVEICTGAGLSAWRQEPAP